MGKVMVVAEIVAALDPGIDVHAGRILVDDGAVFAVELLPPITAVSWPPGIICNAFRMAVTRVLLLLPPAIAEAVLTTGTLPCSEEEIVVGGTIASFTFEEVTVLEAVTETLGFDTGREGTTVFMANALARVCTVVGRHQLSK